MALRLLINAIDRIGYLERGSLRINQDAATYVSTCYFTLIDPNNVITATIKHTVVVDDPALGVVYFDGTVANVDFDPLGGGTSPKRRVKIQCQDNNILVEEAIIAGPINYVTQPDIAIINDLFTLYLPAFDAVTHVHAVDAAITLDLRFVTLREAMKRLCDQSGGFWYIRGTDVYYGDEADFGLVGWDLSDTPAPPASYGYLHDTSRKFHGSNMVNVITVVGLLDAAGGITRQDPVSRGLYGDHSAITIDNRITTVLGAQKRGDAILDEWSMPRESYTVKTYPGNRVAIAGQRIRYINSVYGINDIFTIRRLSISFPSDTVLYTMSLGDDLDLGLLGQRIFLGKIEEALEPVEPEDLPLSSMGWSHDLEFTATDFNTIHWSVGTITTASGTTYNIAPAADTGNMVAVTARYVYLDVVFSITALRHSDIVANAVGPQKILLAVCYPSADAAIDATVQVFGGAGNGTGIFINADNIAADCITANEIHANAIQAGHIVAGAVTTIKIDALAITTGKIAAGAVTADKLQIGEMFFNDVDGLILLGPHSEINPPTVAPWIDGQWWTFRRQFGTLTGAFRQMGGRWIDTRALAIERGTTNLCENPSFEIAPVLHWTGQNAVLTRVTDYFMYGEYCGKTVTANAAAIEGAYCLVTTTTAANTTYTFSIWVRSRDVGTVRVGCWDDVTGYQWGAVHNLTPQWTRLVTTKTYGVASTIRYMVCATDVQQALTYWIDGAQIEQLVFVTSYCDGSLGAGYVWTGATHNSTSTRTDTDLDLGPFTTPLLNNTEYSFRILAQMPEAHDGNWPTGGNYVLDVRGLNDNNRIIVAFDPPPGTEAFGVYLNGDWRMASAAQTFEMGDWLDIVLTLDWTNDDYNLYINGILEDNDTTVLAVPLVTKWALGGKYDGTVADTPGCVFCEHALFDIVLSAEQVAQMYNLQRPLVDSGAVDTPGIYIYNGRFRIASSTTGNRIEITADEIVGYDSAGVRQFYLQSSDGTAYCGGGDVVLDDDGITIACGAGVSNWITWQDGGTVRHSIRGSVAGNDTRMFIYSGPCAAAGNSEMTIEAIEAGGAGTGAQIWLFSGGTGVITFSLIGAEEFRITNTGFSTSAGAWRWQPRGYIAGVQVDTGYVNVKINGVDYKLLARL